MAYQSYDGDQKLEWRGPDSPDFSPIFIDFERPGLEGANGFEVGGLGMAGWIVEDQADVSPREIGLQLGQHLNRDGRISQISG
jgi:hypothetical protein